ncbi:MAG: GntP family permease [Bacteroidales bacterium]|nr:GntP family permease [Bacteroidales bacterium]
MTGIPLILTFFAAIAAMILLIARLHVHPFLAILAISLLLALLAGIPLTQIPGIIGSGFAGTFTSIGIVIILGAFIGAVLEKTGAALKLADMVIGLVGEKHPALAVEMMGWVVSIPVFCDSGFVILDPIRKALVRRTGASSVALTLCLSCGLYVAHVFIPPTPGPPAAAQALGMENNVLLIIGMGILCSVFPLIAGYFFARFAGRKVKSEDERSGDRETVASYEELKAGFGKLPSGVNALAPLVVPILLMALSSVASMAHWSGRAADLCLFLGTPVIALAAGACLAIGQLFRAGKGKDFYPMTNETLKTVGPILFVTAAGGVLGKVIASSDMVHFITGHAEGFRSIGIFFPFLLAAVLKTAQGSSTVAITTTAGIVAPLMTALGIATPVDAALVVVAIGAGAMTVSHANDSYFWVVTSFGRLTVGDGYRTQTLMTLVIGLASILEVFLLSLIF